MFAQIDVLFWALSRSTQPSCIITFREVIFLPENNDHLDM